MSQASSTRISCLPALLAVVAGAVYTGFALSSESQGLVFGLLLGGGLALGLARRMGLLHRAGRSMEAWPRAFGAAALTAVACVCLWFHDDPFVLFLIATVLVYTLACFGLNIQFGFVGVVNFAGASFLGVGCYTAAILTKHTAVPHVLALLAGGLAPHQR